MVLASFGDERSETELGRILESYEFGTPAHRVRNLAQIGYSVQYGTFTLDELKNAIQGNLAPIVFVDATWLPEADFEGFHAVVLIRLDTQSVYVHDPASGHGYAQIALGNFQIAWEEFDRRAAIINREK